MNKPYMVVVQYKGTWWATLIEEAWDEENAASLAWDTLRSLGVSVLWRERYNLIVSEITNIALDKESVAPWAA